MPFQRDGKRDYKRELAWEKSRAKNRAGDRVKRVLARRKLEKETGDRPASQHVDHKRRLGAGGTNARSNLRWVSARANLAREGRRKSR